MKIIILSTLGALVLLGIGIYILLHLKSTKKYDAKAQGDGIKLGQYDITLDIRWLYGYLGYTCVIAATVIVLIMQTWLTQQERTLQNTQERFQQELGAFRDRLGDQTEKLMSQINEKAQLTGSEVEVRGKLQNEIDHHKRTQKELADARDLMRQIQTTLDREKAAHRAYLDSLNTERALHASAQNRLDREMRLHGEAQTQLRDTRQNLAQSQERVKVQDRQLKELNGMLEKAQANAKKALENAEMAAIRLMQKSDEHQQSLMTIQAATDSIYKRVLRRAREDGAND